MKQVNSSHVLYHKKRNLYLIRSFGTYFSAVVGGTFVWTYAFICPSARVLTSGFACRGFAFMSLSVALCPCRIPWVNVNSVGDERAEHT